MNTEEGNKKLVNWVNRYKNSQPNRKVMTRLTWLIMKLSPNGQCIYSRVNKYSIHDCGMGGCIVIRSYANNRYRIDHVTQIEDTIKTGVSLKNIHSGIEITFQTQSIDFEEKMMVSVYHNRAPLCETSSYIGKCTDINKCKYCPQLANLGILAIMEKANSIRTCSF